MVVPKDNTKNSATLVHNADVLHVVYHGVGMTFVELTLAAGIKLEGLMGIQMSNWVFLSYYNLLEYVLEEQVCFACNTTTTCKVLEGMLHQLDIIED